MGRAETRQHNVATTLVDPNGMPVQIAVRDAQPMQSRDPVEEELGKLKSAIPVVVDE
ncbi:hypothetical protein BOSE62_71334 [Bosea sp. 62]|nr:hypothetical protein BOSE21B_90296 [Bosea sp. 21B]CAD5295432.1 hypothetical protein BOSE46_80390 [Bosea sp. 46]CAD5298403.1 hypothetical protein BOSE7B_60370 [Bosea sp. 7B]VVT60941.1 hypothetical protein BOS5A_230218 [Bosea sp. EC-HK365B]VXB35571.1 hypothetical protein BOSE127_110369 [Bosea sp. 127]VXB58070.1 hypothetical protein BOSE125_131137 [Bosea sp. 125]VXC76584.1 hypothetical protein BOSE29B_80280 [Bosea sp. 29B]VXC90196.1 hypothetical protein BOSE62_71334 [Bosea sp. 62]